MLTDEQIKQFQEKGYLVFEGLIQGEKLLHYKQVFDAMEIADHQKTKGMHGSWTKVDESRAVDLEIPAGTVVVFSANLLHGAHDNLSDRTRYSTAWHYIPGDLHMERFVRGEYEDRHIVRGN
jgi:hypothetical protein